MKVLIAEDERKVRDFVKLGLEEAGMVVDAISTLDELKSSLLTTTYDVLVLDRILHGQDVVEHLDRLQAKEPKARILILSALSDAPEKVKGLEEGADDYLGKPFHIPELVARVRALMRRTTVEREIHKDTLLEYADLKIDLSSQRVYRNTSRIDLTGKEFRLLCLLAKQPGHVFSKVTLLNQCWDMNHFPESNVVEVTVAGLRSKLEKGFTPLIHSRRGVGYWLGSNE
ncbi:MAG: response regulator transcription factor [Deltaproteobacteria bacterium]|nr:response regulator transcription factor [Deltaproteobacteria bacterium]